MTPNKQLICVIILLSIFHITSAFAGNTPNFYECKGKDITLTYSTSGIASSVYALLDIGHKQFSADEASLSSQTTVMGEVKSLVVKTIPDVEVIKASFIIPAINLGQDSHGQFVDVRFKSQLILTKIVKPITTTASSGVMNQSKYIDIICTATLVF